MYEEMEHLTVDQGISFPNEDERGIKESANVQALHAEVEGQLDWPQIESPIVAMHARRQKIGRRETVVGRGR